MQSELEFISKNADDSVNSSKEKKSKDVSGIFQMFEPKTKCLMIQIYENFIIYNLL